MHATPAPTSGLRGHTHAVRIEQARKQAAFTFGGRTHKDSTMTFTMDKMADLYNQRSRALESLKELDRQAGKREFNREEERKAARIEAEIDIADEQIKAGLSERQNASIRKMKDEVLGFGGGESGVRAETLSRSIGELLQVGSRNEGTFTLDLDETAIYEKRDLLTTTAGASVITDFAKDLEVIKSQGSPIWERARKDHNRSHPFNPISRHKRTRFRRVSRRSRNHPRKRSNARNVHA